MGLNGRAMSEKPQGNSLL